MVTLNKDVVEFQFYRPEAQQVHLVGDFNNWQRDLLMQRGDDGYWRVQLALPAGEFRFRYCADGAWFTDFAAFGVEPGGFGLDSVVRVPTVPLQVALPNETSQIAAA